MSKKQPHDAKRSGTERAAIFLLSLGEQEATEVMRHMGAKDVQRRRDDAAAEHLAR